MHIIASSMMHASFSNLNTISVNRCTRRIVLFLKSENARSFLGDTSRILLMALASKPTFNLTVRITPYLTGIAVDHII